MHAVGLIGKPDFNPAKASQGSAGNSQIGIARQGSFKHIRLAIMNKDGHDSAKHAIKRSKSKDRESQALLGKTLTDLQEGINEAHSKLDAHGQALGKHHDKLHEFGETHAVVGRSVEEVLSNVAEAHTKLDAHGHKFERLSTFMDDTSQHLEAHGDTLKVHKEISAALSDHLAKHGETLREHREISVAASSSMEKATSKLQAERESLQADIGATQGLLGNQNAVPAQTLAQLPSLGALSLPH